MTTTTEQERAAMRARAAAVPGFWQADSAGRAAADALARDVLALLDDLDECERLLSQIDAVTGRSDA